MKTPKTVLKSAMLNLLTLVALANPLTSAVAAEPAPVAPTQVASAGAPESRQASMNEVMNYASYCQYQYQWICTPYGCAYQYVYICF